MQTATSRKGARRAPSPAPHGADDAASNKQTFLDRVKARVKTVTAKVTTTIKGAATKVSAFVRRNTIKAAPVAYRVWTRSVRPLLKGVLTGVLFVAVIAGMAAAPLTTVLITAGAGLALYAMGRLADVLIARADTSRFARGFLTVAGVLYWGISIGLYAGAAAAAVFLAAKSVPFLVAALVIMTLGYLQVPSADTIGFLTYCVLSGNLILGAAWLAWWGAYRLTARHMPRGSAPMPGSTVEYAETEAYTETEDYPEEPSTPTIPEPPPAIPPYPRPDTLQEQVMSRHHITRPYHGAGGTEEVAHVQPQCAFCDESPYNLQVEDVLKVFMTAKDLGALVCDACFSKFEKRAIDLTGLSLLRDRTQVKLTAVGRAALSEVAKSVEDSTGLYWATVAWWRDRKGRLHDRQWDCFLTGETVATIVYDHDRRVMRVSADGRFLTTKSLRHAAAGGVTSFQGALDEAKRIAEDYISDARSAGVIAGFHHVTEPGSAT